jgi:Ca-activated chloride channel family protein
MPQFQYIQLLWALLLIPVLVGVYFYARRKKQIAFKKIGDEALVKELTASYNRSSFWKKFVLVITAMALILVSIANLRSQEGAQKISRNGIDVMIALDVSKSMLAKDIQPNRLERAKQLLNRLIDKMSNDRIGIVVFAGKAYLQMPLTADHSAAKMYLSAATPETVPTQGTVIGDALKMCFASFNAKEKKYKAVVLISDGEDHDENALKIAEQMAGEGVSINTVGIGSPQGAPIMDETTNELKKDAEGNTVITKLNEDELRSIADKGNGTYQLFTNTDAAVAGIYDQLATMDRRTVTDDSLVNWKSWFQYLLGAALLFLIIELFISEIKSVSVRKMKIAAATIFFSLLSFSSLAQNEKEVLKKGNEEYKKADYSAAAATYGEVVKKNDANSTAQYNLGNALYKSDKKEDALTAYEKAQSQMTNYGERSNALYNKGVVLQNDKKLEDCIVAYKNALKLDPNNEDARHNLQLALKKQQQEKQKQDQDKKDKDDSKDKNKKPDDKDNSKQPKPKPSNISQKDAAQKLDALMQKEKDLQDKLHKVNAASPDKPEKDW